MLKNDPEILPEDLNASKYTEYVINQEVEDIPGRFVSWAHGEKLHYTRSRPPDSSKLIPEIALSNQDIHDSLHFHQQILQPENLDSKNRKIVSSKKLNMLPYSAIIQLRIRFLSQKLPFSATAVLVGPRHALTCSDVFTLHVKNEKSFEIRGIIARDEDKCIGIAIASKYFCFENSKVALIVFEETIGYTFGWFGITCFTEEKKLIKIQPRIAGYSYNKDESNKIISSKGVFSEIQNSKLLYKINSIQVTVGSPIWQKETTECSIIGIHLGSEKNFNYGEKITLNLFFSLVKLISQTADCNCDIYNGEYLNGKKHGFGSCKFGKALFKGDFYEGEWIDDKLHGNGTYIWANGDKYTGGWKEGMHNGHGVYQWINGDRYEGDWLDHQRHGKGKYWLKDLGEKYEGEWTRGKFHGIGIYYYASGDRYEGIWKEDKRDGYGTTYYANGDRYEGERLLDLKHGIGKMFYSNGDLFEGIWGNGKRIELGIYTFANGNRYEGDWKDDKKHGRGKFIWKNGNTYEGDWENNQRSGHGKYQWVNGDVYEGDWKNDLMHGEGIYIWAEGDWYEGDWIHDKKHGFGRLYLKSGAKYYGMWNNDIKQGNGVYFWPNGNRFEGVWREDKIEGKGIFYEIGKIKEEIWANDTLLAELKTD